MKKHLRETFVKLLEERDASTITMTNLATAAQVNRSTIYRYYGSLSELLGDCIYCIACRADLNAPAVDDPHFLSKIYQGIVSSYTGIYENAKLFSLIDYWEGSSPNFAPHRVYLSERSALYYDEIVAVLHELKPDMGVDRTYLRAALSAISGSTIDCWRKGGFIESPKEMALVTVSLFQGLFIGLGIPVPDLCSF